MKLNLTDRDTARYWAKVDRRGPEDCWPWLGCVRRDNNSGIYSMRGRFGFYNVVAHHVGKFLADGDVPADQLALHSCGNNLCQNPAHIFWISRVEIGRVLKIAPAHPLRGEAHPRAKLTAADVRDIRDLKQQGLTAYAIGKMKSVDPANVRRILAGETWRTV